MRSNTGSEMSDARYVVNGFVVLFVGDHQCWFVVLFVLIFSSSAMSVSPRIMPDGSGSKWEDELNPPDNVPTLHMLEFQTKNEGEHV